MKEILRYLQIDESALTTELKEKILRIKEELISACRPKSVFCEIENIDIFNSNSLNNHLSDCKRFFLFAATLGTQADFIIRRYQSTDITSAAIAQAAASELIESFCDSETEAFYKNGLFLKPRFSPGYGDFDISYQKYILERLDAYKRIGLTLTDGMMMIPEKSVTAVLGLSENNHCLTSKCENCSNINCEYRSR